MTTRTTTETTTPTESQLVSDFKAARRCSVPIVAIETPDPANTIATIAGVTNGAPVLEWDIVRGLHGRNAEGKEAQNAAGISGDATINPVSALEAIAKLPPTSLVFAHNAHRQLADPAVVQAVWNLRDLFKLDRRTLVLLAPAMILPDEIAGDVVVLDEPLPTRTELRDTVRQQYRNGDLALPSADVEVTALDAIVGLPTFAAEQVVAMSLSKRGINVPKLWERKRKAIENTDGLRVYRGGETFADLEGIDNVKAFMRRLVDAKAFGTVVFIDEGDKALAGGMSDYTGDSGVSKDQVGVILSYIEDTRSLGVMLGGLAGTGKSALAKATGHEAGKVTIQFDLGGMKGGTVGQSERQIRAALKVVTATAEGRVLFVMTANNTTVFTPEINRRFPDQFFFDVPGAEGRAKIWEIYRVKNGLTDEHFEDCPAGFDSGWTGAEIKRACERAAMFGCSVYEASRYIVPTVISNAEKIERMRQAAAGKFLSAHAPGLYQVPRVSVPTVAKGSRKVDLE